MYVFRLVGCFYVGISIQKRIQRIYVIQVSLSLCPLLTLQASSGHFDIGTLELTAINTVVSPRNRPQSVDTQRGFKKIPIKSSTESLAFDFFLRRHPAPFPTSTD